MSSPVQIGDVIAILREIHSAYAAWKTLPQKLKRALHKFEEAEQDIKKLNDILLTCRQSEYQSYPGTQQLLDDVKAARDYLQQYEPLTDASGKTRMSRVKSYISARWNEDVVDTHVEKIDFHLERIDKFRQTVLLLSTLDNAKQLRKSLKLQRHINQTSPTQLQANEPARDDTSTISSDQLSVLTKASRSLEKAYRLGNSSFGLQDIQLSPIVEASSASVESEGVNEEVKNQIADYIERTRLYTRVTWQIDQISDLEYISSLSAQHARIQERLQRSNQILPASPRIATTYATLFPPSAETSPFTNASSIGHTSSHLPPIPSQVPPTETDRSTLIVKETQSAADKLTADTLSLTPSWRKVFSNLQEEDKSIRSIQTEDRILAYPARSFDDDDSDAISFVTDDSDPDPAAENDFILSEPVLVVTPWMSSAIKCHMKMIQTEGSLNIQSRSIKALPQDRMPTLGGCPYEPRMSGLTVTLNATSKSPSSVLLIQPSTTRAIRSRDSAHLVLNHVFAGGLQSFPHILHPSVENAASSTDTHPYKIDFYNHQFLQIEGYNTLAKAVKGVAYYFRNKVDRDRVREKMFGKELLASVGIASIQLDKRDIVKPCGTQAASLWLKRSGEAVDGSAGEDSLSITVQCNSRGKSTDPDCALELSVVKVKNLDKVRDRLGKELTLLVQPFFATTLGEEKTAELAEPPQTFLRRRSSASSRLIAVFIKFTENSDDHIQAKQKFVDALKMYSQSE